MKAKYILIFICLFLSCEDKKSAPTKKNILMIIVDDMRPEIHSWGNSMVITPNIDSLVMKGVSFKRAYAQYANCSPSRMSFLTGISPENLGHKGNYNDKTQFRSHFTLPGYMKKHGYKTYSFGKVYHDIRDDSLSWDHIYDIKRINGDPKWESYGSPNNQRLEKGERPAIERGNFPLENYNDYQITKAFENHLSKHKKDLFFYAIGFRKPHLPFAAPEKYWELYNKSEIKISEFGNAPINGDTIIYQWSELAAYQGYDKNYFETNYRNIKVRDEEAKDLSHGYLASVSFIDELVGRLVNTLKKHDLEKNTIIVFMSDHGFHLGDQQIWGKHSSYEKSTHTPLIIVDPSKANGGTCMNFVELLDIYPTLIDLNGIDKNPDLDGKSLAIFVEDPNLRSPRLAFSQYQTFQKHRSFSNYMAYAVYTKDFNYIEWQDLDNNRNVVQKELYQMDRVRAEITNLSNQPRYSMLQHALSSKIKKNFNF